MLKMSKLTINKIKYKELKTLFHEHKVIKIYFSFSLQSIKQEEISRQTKIIHRNKGKKEEKWKEWEWIGKEE